MHSDFEMSNFMEDNKAIAIYKWDSNEVEPGNFIILQMVGIILLSLLKLKMEKYIMHNILLIRLIEF